MTEGYSSRKARYRKRVYNGVHELVVEKIRACLRCGNEFPSTGAGHRLCMGCNRVNRHKVSRRVGDV